MMVGKGDRGGQKLNGCGPAREPGNGGAVSSNSVGLTDVF